MPGSERYFGDKDAFRAAGKHLLIAKTVADTKVTDAGSFARSSAFVFAHSVLDASITSVCEAAALLKPEEWVGYIEGQQVSVAEDSIADVARADFRSPCRVHSSALS